MISNDEIESLQSYITGYDDIFNKLFKDYKRLRKMEGKIKYRLKRLKQYKAVFPDAGIHTSRTTDSVIALLERVCE